MTASPRERLAALTGLRFAAALGILLYHYGAPLTAGAPAWIERVRTGGHAWVGLFYVLSGFVLAWANPEPLDPPARRAFWIARGARLYPAYLLAFGLSAPFALERWAGGGPLGVAKAAVVAGAALLLVQAWAPPIARLWNTPGWSTSVVAAFYAAFPFLAARLARLSRRGLAAAALGAWAAALALPLAYLALRPDGPVDGETLRWDEPLWLEALKFHPLARAGEFACGVALGLLHRRGVALPRAGAAAAPLALGGAVALLAWGGAPFVLVHNGLLVPLFAIAILGLATGRGPLARALGSRPAAVLGDASFALYALQEPLWLWSRTLAAADRGAPASAAFVVAYAATAAAIAVLVSRLLERPARRALRAAFGGERMAVARAVPATAVRRPA
ncbi:MAG TPA: acyltransferase [Anaeromyxobacter sp.]|nr:acyltransferase [Anaeromyxobacter sp.]